MPLPLARLLGAALLSLAFTPAGAQPPALVIGQIVDQQGSDQEASRDYVIGAKIWFDHVNAQGGLGGRRIVHLVVDHRGDPQRAVALAKDLVDTGRADVLFGLVGESALHALARSHVLEASGVPLVSPLTGHPPASEHVFVTRPSQMAELRKVAQHFGALGMRRLALIMAEETDPALAATLARGAAEYGVQLVGQVVLKPGVDAASGLQAAYRSEPQALIVVGDSVVFGRTVKAHGARRLSMPIVGLSLVNHRVVLDMVGAQGGHGVMLAQVVPNPSGAVLPVVQEHLALMRKYLDEPPSHLTLGGFIAAKALTQVLKSVGPPFERRSVLAALRAQPHREVGGVAVDYLPSENATQRVELTMLRQSGELLY